MYHETSYDLITNNLLIDVTKKITSKNKNTCMIFDHCENYTQLTKLLNVSSHFRTILNSKNGGGMLLLSDTNYETIPQRLRNSANTFIIGKLSLEEYKVISNDLGDLFNGSDDLLQKLTDNIILNTDYLILMVEGNNVYQKPCIYKNWEELI